MVDPFLQPLISAADRALVLTPAQRMNLQRALRGWWMTQVDAWRRKRGPERPDPGWITAFESQLDRFAQDVRFVTSEGRLTVETRHKEVLQVLRYGNDVVMRMSDIASWMLAAVLSQNRERAA